VTTVIGTGEHGVGVGKKEYLVEELGEGTVELMKTIKRAVDPYNILNPGKVQCRSNSPGVGSHYRFKLYPESKDIEKPQV
jgi:D-lactate dehydrogenase (cytochrome)